MRFRIVPLVAAIVIASSAAPAAAERHPEHMITLGYQTEHADVVALARPGPTTVDRDRGLLIAGFDVERSIRGELAAGERLPVVARDLGHGHAWEDGKLYLVFLRRTELDGEPRLSSLSGSFGFREIVAGTPSARFPAICTEIAATLGEGAQVREQGVLRALLAGLVTDPNDGIAASAAQDLARHEELLAGLDDAQRLAIIESFRTRAPGRARRQIALAVAATRHVEAPTVLVDALLHANARLDRGGIAEALFRLNDPRAESRLLTRLASADAEQKQNLLVATGKIGGAKSVDTVVARLNDAEPAVRVEAAHALGCVARNVHGNAPGEVVAGRDELLALLDAAQKATANEGARNEVRAAIWALAQLDDPLAYAALRRIAAESKRPVAVREYAARILERPRIGLILD